MTTLPDFECSCADCQSACRNKPGWFLPGEVEALAANMGVSLIDLFQDRLAVDWWAEDDELEETFVLSPAIKGHSTGTEFPGNPNGICTFFKDGRCEIHAMGKPHECASLTHDGHAAHIDTARAWAGHQESITSLLGREAIAEEFTIFDLLSLWR